MEEQSLADGPFFRTPPKMCHIADALELLEAVAFPYFLVTRPEQSLHPPLLAFRPGVRKYEKAETDTPWLVRLGACWEFFGAPRENGPFGRCTSLLALLEYKKL